MPLTKNSIEHVVEDELCHRCGACVAICPVPQCITFDETFYPAVSAKTCVECGMCEDVCSGDKLEIDGLKATLPTPPYISPLMGGFHQPHMVFSTDQRVRARGSSGGFVTQLLITLLEHGEIHGAVVAGMNPEAPWEGIPRIARSADEVCGAAGSKYTAVPMVNVLDQIIRHRHGRYAFVGVACHIHSLRMMIKRLPHLRDKIHSTVGLFCKSAFDPEAITDLLRCSDVPLSEVEEVQYRGGPWPGVMRARMRDGRHVVLHSSNFRDGAYNYMMQLYTQPRCWQCFDYGNELSDLAICDPWVRGPDGRYLHEGGHTLVLPRTSVGLALMELVKSEPRFSMETVGADYLEAFDARAAESKLRTVAVRIDRLRALGKPYAVYDREMPALSAKDRRKHLIVSLSILVSRTRRLRYLILRFLVSRPAVFLVYLRQIRKFGFAGFRYVSGLTPRPGSKRAGRRRKA